MTLAPMRYKGHTWLHNPKEISVTSEKTAVELQLPYHDAVLQDHGRKNRVIQGVGDLYGNDCIQQYEALWSLYCQQGPGLLSIPDLQPMNATFAQLKIEAAPTPELLTYSFQFRENLYGLKEKRQDTFAAGFHTVVYNETLWDIAHGYNISIDALVLRNRNIKRPDRLTPGERVYLK